MIRAALLVLSLLVLWPQGQVRVQRIKGTPVSGFNGFAHRRSVTIDNAQIPNSNQTNFPFPVVETQNDFRTTGNGGDVTDAEGDDIVFTADSGCTSLLKFERVSYNAATGAIQYFVRLPTASTSVDTVIWMCYGKASVTTFQGDPANVWDANFVGVWHLEGLNDSTAAANTLTNNNSTASGTGKVGSCFDFESSSSQTLSSSTMPTTVTDNFTLELWANPETASQGVALAGNGTVPDGGWQLRHSEGACTTTGGSIEAAYIGGSCFDSGLDFTGTGSWDYLVMRRGSGNLTVTKNTTVSSTLSTDTPNAPTGNNFVIGARAPIGTTYDGRIDEVRVSNIARSNDWLAATFNSMSPGTFYTLGAEE